MLYDKEELDLTKYDPETGIEKEIELEKLEKREILRLRGEASAMASLLQTSGWKIMKKILETKIDFYKNKLVLESDMKKVLRLQEAVKTYIDMLNLPEYIVILSQSLSTQAPDEGDNL